MAARDRIAGAQAHHGAPAALDRRSEGPGRRAQDDRVGGGRDALRGFQGRRQADEEFGGLRSSRAAACARKSLRRAAQAC